MKSITERWEQGIPHDIRSQKIFNGIAELDFIHGSDFFRFKSGGDGDNGEHLMYLLDMYFEIQDANMTNNKSESYRWQVLFESVMRCSYCAEGTVIECPIHNEEYFSLFTTIKKD